MAVKTCTLVPRYYLYTPSNIIQLTLTVSKRNHRRVDNIFKDWSCVWIRGVERLGGKVHVECSVVWEGSKRCGTEAFIGFTWIVPHEILQLDNWMAMSIRSGNTFHFMSLDDSNCQRNFRLRRISPHMTRTRLGRP